MRKGARKVWVWCCIALAGGFLHTAAQAGVISPEVQSALKSDVPVPVIVTLKDKVLLDKFQVTGKPDKLLRRTEIVSAMKDKAVSSQVPLRNLLTNRGITPVRSLWIINGMAATLPPSVIRELAVHPAVENIAKDRALTAPKAVTATTATPEWNITMINAPELWGIGYTGTGVVVANMDTGVDPDHPDLAARWRGGSNSWYDPNGQHAAPYDANGHGTQTMGVMVGGDAGGTSIGMAPGAKWIAVKIYDDSDTTTYSIIHDAFQWLLDPDGITGTVDAPDVVNISWDLDVVGSCVPEFQTDIGTLKAAGIAVAVSAGNYGSNASTSVSPANYSNSFAVGAVDETKTITSFSSRGPSACGGATFPELVAPGYNIKTADLSFGGVIPNPYAYVTGTSFSAPHVAGAMALLLSALPDLTPAELEQAFTATAVDLGATGADNVYGYGLVDVAAAYIALTGALESISQPSTPTGPVKGRPGIPYTFSTNGSVSSLGDPVQYIFDWGDGTDSGWLPPGTLSASKSWAAGAYTVKARARCSVHQTIISPWSPSVPITVSTPITATVTANYWQSGHLVESKSGSGIGGGGSGGSIIVGDDGRDRQIKGMLSFDTSKIPPSAQILSATLKLTRANIMRMNPFSVLGTCFVDVMKGTFNKKNMEKADFQAPATAPQAISMPDPLVNKGGTTATLGQAAMEAISKGGMTQMRISFSTPTNNNKRADYITFYSGASVRTKRPALEVTFLP
jgi:subtilisin family serine protease